jgi:predicted nucleic acid-binding protein
LIVLDASAAIALLVEEAEPAEWVADRLAGEENVGAPHLIDVEVLSALRRLVARQELPLARAREALEGLWELGIVRYDLTGLLDRIWELRDRVTAYDAAYVVLAEALAVPLVTLDRRLGKTGSHRAEIVAYAG